MATFVKAPDVATSSQISVSFNQEVFFHNDTGAGTQAQLTPLTINGVEEYELTWFGLAIGGNTTNITTEQFQTNIDNTGMTEAFSSIAQGVDWDLILSKTQTKNNVPDTDNRLGAIIETEYNTFNLVTATTLSEAYKEVWTDGKLANDSTDPNRTAYNDSNTLNFATSTMGTGGHIFNDDVTNVLFVAFWGPGRYVKEVAKRFKIRPTVNTTTEYIMQACVRTETQDTVFSDIARLREVDTGLPATGGDSFFFNQGQDTDWVTSAMRDSDTDMIDTVVYPHTSLVQLSYPRPGKFEDKDDQTTFAFIYEGKKIKTQSGSGAISASETFVNTTADVAYDFITNKRYGMGEMIPVSTTVTAVNDEQTNYLRFQLKEAKDRCEEQLTIRDSSGTSSQQNRYTFNSVLDQDANKFETLKKILNNMNAQYYFHNGYLQIYQDKPQDPVKVVNQTNCRDVVISGRNFLPDTNTYYVKYNNERKMFKQDIAFAELRDQLNTGFPVVSKEVVMQGITNKHQAERHARYLAESARTANEVIEYTAGADHVYLKPGDLILFTHTQDDGEKSSDRIKQISSSTVQYHNSTELDVSDTYQAYIDNGTASGTNTFTPFNQTIADDLVFESSAQFASDATTGSTEFTIGSTTGLRSINAGHGSLTAFNRQVFNLVNYDPTPTKANQQEKIFRIQSIVETRPFEYKITAQRYNQNKWIDIDEGFDFAYSFSANNWAETYTET